MMQLQLVDDMVGCGREGIFKRFHDSGCESKPTW